MDVRCCTLNRIPPCPLVSMIADEKWSRQLQLSIRVWFQVKPAKPFTVAWTAGSTSDLCMASRGTSTTMPATNESLTCTIVGQVTVDEIGSCYFRSSIWGLSYTGGQYSGSAITQWETGPFNCDCLLTSSSPGTVICPSQALCSMNKVYWLSDQAGTELWVSLA